MRLIEVKEKARVSDEQARIPSSESDAREEEGVVPHIPGVEIVNHYT